MTEPRKQVRPWPIIGGVVLGVVVCWVWITVSLFAGFSASYGYDNDAAAIGAIALAGLPVLLGIVFLVVPRTRQLGAGFLMGISIGFIAGSGVCASLFVPGTL